MAPPPSMEAVKPVEAVIMDDIVPVMDEEIEPEMSETRVQIGQGLEGIVQLPVWLSDDERMEALAAIARSIGGPMVGSLEDPDESMFRIAMTALGYELRASVVINAITFRVSGKDGQWAGAGKTRKEALNDLLGKMLPSPFARESFKRSIWKLA